MPVRLNIPTEVIWDPILDNYLIIITPRVNYVNLPQPTNKYHSTATMATVTSTMKIRLL